MRWVTDATHVYPCASPGFGIQTTVSTSVAICRRPLPPSYLLLAAPGKVTRRAMAACDSSHRTKVAASAACLACAHASFAHLALEMPLPVRWCHCQVGERCNQSSALARLKSEVFKLGSKCRPLGLRSIGSSSGRGAPAAASCVSVAAEGGGHGAAASNSSSLSLAAAALPPCSSL